MRLALPVIATVVVLLLFSNLTSSAQTQETASVRITPKEINVGLHEPVSTVLAIRNESAQPLSVDLGDDRVSNIVVNTILPDGSEIHSRVPIHQGLARIGRISIAPRESYSQTLVLNNWTGFDGIGLYKLQIEILSPVLAQDGSSTSVRPMFALVRVGNRDEHELTNLCANLLDSLLNARSYNDAQTEAMLLGHVQDPIALPFLRKAIDRTTYPVQSPLVSGLESVGTPEAVRALLELIGKRSAAVPDARASLGRMVDKIPDVDLRKQVQEVLAAKQ